MSTSLNGSNLFIKATHFIVLQIINAKFVFICCYSDHHICCSAFVPASSVLFCYLRSSSGVEICRLTAVLCEQVFVFRFWLLSVSLFVNSKTELSANHLVQFNKASGPCDSQWSSVSATSSSCDSTETSRRVLNACRCYQLK